MASPRRVATRFLRAKVCNPRATSAAWIDPQGKVYILPTGETHDDWAEEYVKKDRGWDGKRPWLYLVDNGWLRFVNYLNIETGTRSTPAAWKAAAELVVGCADSLRRFFDPEQGMLIAEGRKVDVVPIAEFVRRWGGRKLEDEMFEKLF